MRKFAVLFILLLLLLCACEKGASESRPVDTVPNERVITTCSDNLTELESQVLTDFLHSTRIYLTEGATLKDPAKWSCRLNERCLLAIAHWEIGNENGFQPVLIFEEEGHLKAAELGRNAMELLTLSPQPCTSPVQLSFVQRVGDSTIICIGSIDLMKKGVEIKPYDNCGTVPVCVANEENGASGSWSTWIMSSTDPSSDNSDCRYQLATGDCGYLFAIKDMDDDFALYVGEEALTGAYLKSLLSGT